MLHLSAAEALARRADLCFIDVRSPREFTKGSIPGAINIPLFDDHEYEEIGTEYNQVSPDSAMAMGRKIAELKRQAIVARLDEVCGQRDKVIYCWRGGMRSSAVLELVKDSRANKLEGGYKAWRKQILSGLAEVALPTAIFVLHGYTGSGKTKLLNDIGTRVPAIDLEGLASHRGSIFGDVGLTSVSQKDFDSNLFFELDRVKGSPALVLEGESRRIGRIYLNERIAQGIRSGVSINVTASRSWRASYLTAEYGAIFAEQREVVRRRFDLIKPYIGGAIADDLYRRFAAGERESVIFDLLERYYDPLYEKTMRRKLFYLTVDTEAGFTAAADQVVEFIKREVGS